jgi:Zn-dependent M28 family amino/carboxypeptidase
MLCGSLAARLKMHVVAIASEPHNIDHYPALERAAAYIEHVLENLGYEAGGQIFRAGGRAVRNIDATREPTSATSATPTIVIGAHYDSCWDAPGANDNGSGVAAVLELARLLSDWKPQHKRLRLALFVNEEPPYFRTPEMGSWQYAKWLSQRGEEVEGMISLEMLGAFSDEPGSQRYPPPLSFFFPSTANFVAFVGLPGSRTFLHKVVASFRSHTAFPSIGGVGPDLIPGLGWSDHWAFRKFRYPAIMLTDTAFFRYPHYHKPTDTPEKVDYARLARITIGLERVVREIAP